ncbi:MAG: hypothetical protein RJA44_1281 [Pseudomonadota bacterium]
MSAARPGHWRSFLVCQGAFSTLGGYGTVLVYREHGLEQTLLYTALMLSMTMLCIVAPFVLGRWRRAPSCGALIRASFAVPALLLWACAGRPPLLALAFGAFLGLSWSARHWLELSLIDDAGRDHYAAQATVRTVLASLGTTAAVALVLTLNHDAAEAVYASYTLLALAGLLLAARSLPATPPMSLQRPVAVLRQPAFKACLPLYFLESGLLGIGMVLGASGAVQSLGHTSAYGWVASAATLAGAAGLHALRHQRHAANRVSWMGWACLGMMAAQALLGASLWLPGLYVLHMLLQACVQPFWLASEQVLNQRVLDLHGALADRIVVREVVLWLLRLLALAAFWLGTRDLAPHAILLPGTLLVIVATGLEWAIGRAWLRHRPAD